MVMIFLKKMMRPGRFHIVGLEAVEQDILDEEKAVFLNEGWEVATRDDYENQGVISHSRGSMISPPMAGDRPTMIKRGTITRMANASTGVETITGLGFKPSFVLLSAIDDNNPEIYSEGRTDLVQQTCHSGKMDLANVINVQSGDPADGWSATVLAAQAPNTRNGFDINWTKIGQGRSITVKFIAMR